MKKLGNSILVVSFFFITSLVSMALLAQTGDPIGRVLTSKGSVQATAADGQTRDLRRGSQLFEEDRIVTGPNGFAQIRMVDNAIFALKEDTEFAFNQYAFDGNPATNDSAVMEFVRGGFRTISGSISDGDDDTYRVDTAFASIGVRGTTHEGVISFGTLFTGVTDGGTTVSNGFGSVDAGLGADFDYTQTSQGQAPRGLLRRPNQLGQINLNPGTTLDDEDDGGAPGGDGDDGAGTGGQDGDDGAGDGDGNPPNFNGLGTPLGGDNTGNTAPPAATPPAGTNNNNGGGDGGGTTPTPGTNTDQDINPNQGVRDPEDIENGPDGIIDTDGDGVPDDLDAFPNDPLESLDTDGDGVGDNADLFPTDPSESFDSDGDGVGDNGDAFPEDPLEFLDSDGDGVGDNADAFPFDPDRFEEDDSTTGGGSDDEGDGTDPGEPDDEVIVEEEDEEEEEETPPEPVGPPPVVAVLNEAQVLAILDGGRRGFTLSRNFWQDYEGLAPTIFFGSSSDASSGDLVILADLADIGGYELDIEGSDFIFDSLASVASGSLGFTNGINSRTGGIIHDVQWGLWGPAQTLRIYNDVNDNSVFVSPPNMLWVSTAPTDLAPIIGSVSESRFFLGDANFIGGSTIGGLTELFTHFSLDLSTGYIGDGQMEFCLGGDCSNFSGNSQFWSFQFDGLVDTDDNTLFGQPWFESGWVTYLNADGSVDVEAVGIDGIIDGLFTGDGLEAFVGGLSLDSYSSIPALDNIIVDGIFLAEREDRFSSGDVSNMQNSLLVLEAIGKNLRGQSGLDNEVSGVINFLDVDSFDLYAADPNSESVDITSLDPGFGISLQRWEGLITVYPDQFDTENINQDFSGVLLSHDVAYTARFNTAPMNNLRGRFATPAEVSFLGDSVASNDPAYANEFADIDMEFDVDFMTGNIVDGLLNFNVAYCPDPCDLEVWTIVFDGEVDNGQALFTMLPNDGEVEGQITQAVFDYYDDTYDGSLDYTELSKDYSFIGTFVDRGGEPGLVSTFYFKGSYLDSNEDPVNKATSGVVLLESEIENRFDQNAENDLSRLGLVIPALEENTVYGALATTETNTPIFVDNSVSVASNPYNLPAYQNIEYVFLNQGATANSFQLAGDNYDVNLGVWKPGVSGNVVVLQDNLDNSVGFEYSTNVYWNSVAGGGKINNSPFTSNTTFAAPVTTGTSFLGESSEGAIKGIKTYFDRNNTGDVSGGKLNICAGGSDPAACSSDSTHYEITFNGSTTNGVFTASLVSATVEPPNSAPQPLTTITGEFEGLFAGIVTESGEDLYDAFAGGFNFGDSGDPSKFLSGTFVVEREDRLTASEIAALTRPAVMVNNLSGETGLFRSNSTHDYFLGSTEVIKPSATPTPAGNLNGFSFTWDVWSDADVITDNLLYGRAPVDPTQAEPIWWVSSESVKPAQNLTGTYRTILNKGTGSEQQLSFLGTDGDDVPLEVNWNDITLLDIGFNVDLDSGVISGGSFYAETGGIEGNVWNLNTYGGQINGETLTFSFTDSGSGYGTFYLASGTPTPIDSVSMRGIFVNKTTGIAFDGEGVTGGFALGAGNSFLNGVFLAGIEDTNFVDLRLKGLDPLETDEYNPVNNGLVMIGDWNGWSSGFSPVYSGIVAFDDGASPVFLTDWDGIPYTVFKQDNATGANTFPLSSTYPGVQWGIWDMQAGDIGPTAYYDLAAESFDSFDFLPWLVVPALNPSTEITTYTGLVNYGFTRASMSRNNWGGTLSALNFSMGLDFTTGYIHDGTINLCFGGTGCASADESWHGHFDYGIMDEGVIEPLWIYGSVSNGWDFEGEIAGFLTGYNAPPNDYPNPPPYDALVGGFNLAEGNCGEGCSSYTGRTVSGTFLSEPEMRLSASDMYYVDGHVRGALMKPDGTVLTGLVGTHNASYASTVFFIDESTPNDTVWQLGSFADTNHIHAVQYGGNCDEGCDVQLGIWNGDATLYDNNTDISTPATVTGPIAWLNYEPVDFSDIGFTRYGDEATYATMSFNSDDAGFTDINPGYGLTDFEFEFDTDFSTGVIEGTTIIAKTTETVEGVTLDFVWTLNFTPNNNIQDGVGFFNTADFSNGTLEIWSGSTLEDTVAVDNAILSGAFSFSEIASNNEAYVVGSLLLEADFNFSGFNINSRVVGEYESYGYRETRLTRGDLLAMNNYLGLLVKQNSNIVEEHFLTNGNNSDMTFAQTSLIDNYLDDPAVNSAGDPDGYIHDELFGNNPVTLLVENSGNTSNPKFDSATSTDPAINVFNVGWGIWDGGADIVNATGGTSAFISEDVYWLSAQRADIQDLKGVWRYDNVLAAEGAGTDGTLTSLDMSFDVNFGNGIIDNGQFEAVVDSTRWYTKFTGSAHGPVANINDFSNATIGTDADYSLNPAATMTGEMRGIFTGTGVNQGFATGFAIQGTTDGGSTFSNLNGVGLLGRGVELVP